MLCSWKRASVANLETPRSRSTPLGADHYGNRAPGGRAFEANRVYRLLPFLYRVLRHCVRLCKNTTPLPMQRWRPSRLSLTTFGQ
jgi:hypothetical protein